MCAPSARAFHDPDGTPGACPDGSLDTPRPCPLPRPGVRVAAARRSRTAACGAELQGALSASGQAGTRRARQGALRNPESGGLCAPPPPALPPGGAGCRWRTLRRATEAGTVGGECVARRAPAVVRLLAGRACVWGLGGGDPKEVSVMRGSGGRGGLPSRGCEPHQQALSLIYALPSFHLSPRPSPRRGSPSLRSVSPFSALHPRSLPTHPLFSRKPSHAYLLRLPDARLFPPSSALTVPAATPTGSHYVPAPLLSDATGI